MDKTPGQVAIEAWHECGNGFERKMEHVAKAVIDHVRPQIEREAKYAERERCARVCIELYENRFCRVFGDDEQFDGQDYADAIRALAEGK